MEPHKRHDVGVFPLTRLMGRRMMTPGAMEDKTKEEQP